MRLVSDLDKFESINLIETSQPIPHPVIVCALPNVQFASLERKT